MPGRDESQDRTRRGKDAIVAVQRITNSRRLDVLRAQRSGVPLSLVATGVLYQVVEWGPLRGATLAPRPPPARGPPRAPPPPPRRPRRRRPGHGPRPGHPPAHPVRRRRAVRRPA